MKNKKFNDMLDLNSDKLSIKYSGNVPQDYDFSPMMVTFDFIYLVYKRDSSIQKAIEGVAREYDLSEEQLSDYLIENKYLIDKIDKNKYSELLKKYNTKALKRMLKEHGLKTSGKRERIEERIIENNILGNDFYLSSKSKIFYKNKKRRIRIFNEYLYKYYYFNEFNEFYMDNYRKKEENIPTEFILRHITKSSEDKNHDSFILNNQIMAEYFYKKEKFSKMLEYTLTNFCMNLNPIWKIDELKEHVGIYNDTYDDLLYLEENLSKNFIISKYYLIWDSFNFERIIVSKYEGYLYLKEVLNFKDLSKINHDLKDKFYSNDDLKIKKITQKTLFDF